jgi:site-specific recombinase XerD
MEISAGYVFCEEDGTPLNPGHDVYEQFKIVLRKAGLPAVPFHGLRHSTATLLLSKGVRPKIVQEILGGGFVGNGSVLQTRDILSLRRRRAILN